MVGEVLSQQRGRPDGRAVREVTRVGVDDRINERINDACQSPGAAWARSLSKSRGEFFGAALVDPRRPLVDNLAGDLEPRGDRRDRFALREPQQGLGTAQRRGFGCRSYQLFDHAPLPTVQNNESH